MPYQNYPRSEDKEKSNRKKPLLDINWLKPSLGPIPDDVIKSAITRAFNDADKKSTQDMQKNYGKPDLLGKKVFRRFHKYCISPSTTARQLIKKHYAAVAQDEYSSALKQRQRMHEGWANQKILSYVGQKNLRFINVEDSGINVTDIIVRAESLDRKLLTIYIVCQK